MMKYSLLLSAAYKRGRKRAAKRGLDLALLGWGGTATKCRVDL